MGEFSQFWRKYQESLKQKSAPDFSTLDSMVKDGEEKEFQEKVKQAEKEQKYFADKIKRRLERKSINDMSWEEVHQLNDIAQESKTNHNIRKGAADHFDNQDESSTLTDKENIKEIFEILNKILVTIPTLRGKVTLKKTALCPKKEAGILKALLNEDKKKENIIIKSGGKRIVEGVATSNSIDNTKEIVSLDNAKEAMKQFMKRGGNLNLEHTNRTIGKVLDYDIKKDGDKISILIKAELFKGDEDSDEVWHRVQSGELKAFSIGGKSTSTETMCDDESNQCYPVFNGLRLYEISLVPEPANRDAVMTNFRGN